MLSLAHSLLLLQSWAGSLLSPTAPQPTRAARAVWGHSLALAFASPSQTCTVLLETRFLLTPLLSWSPDGLCSNFMNERAVARCKLLKHPLTSKFIFILACQYVSPWCPRGRCILPSFQGDPPPSLGSVLLHQSSLVVGLSAVTDTPKPGLRGGPRRYVEIALASANLQSEGLFPLQSFLNPSMYQGRKSHLVLALLKTLANISLLTKEMN